MKLTILNKTRGTSLGSKIEVADTAWTRAKGLLGRRELPEECGLLITPCNSIHMFFMRFAIDVAFLDESDKVVRAVHSIKPWRATWFYPDAVSALELPAGTLLKTGTEKGDQLELLTPETDEEAALQQQGAVISEGKADPKTDMEKQSEDVQPAPSAPENEISECRSEGNGKK